MKQILYFIIGILISLTIMMPFANACLDPNDPLATHPSWSTLNRINLGHYATGTGAEQAVTNYLAAHPAIENYCWGSPNYYYLSYTVEGCNLGIYHMASSYYSWCVLKNTLVYATVFLNPSDPDCVYCDPPPPCPDPVDSDGDGYFDYQDLDPQDPDPHSWYLLTEWTQGETLVGRTVLLDNGTIRLFGDGEGSGATPWVQITGEWHSQASFIENFGLDPCGEQHAPINPGDADYPELTGIPPAPEMPFPEDLETVPGTGEPGSPGEFEGGDTTDGNTSGTTEGGIGQINTNLGVLNGNIKGLGAVMQGVSNGITNVNGNLQAIRGQLSGVGTSLNGIGTSLDGIGTSLDGIGTSLDGIGTSLDGIGTSLDDIKGEAEAAAGQEALEEETNGTSDFYTDTNFQTGYTEGTDFDAAPGLDQQGWLTSFIQSNPLATALTNSGFQTTNESCTMTLNLGSMGTHELSLCSFSDQFSLAGTILFGISSLGALLMIAKGV